ncbi:MAG: hypothetical protein NXI25_26920 [bacterium]|nr:hypothetical protein [bacterium]
MVKNDHCGWPAFALPALNKKWLGLAADKLLTRDNMKSVSDNMKSGICGHLPRLDKAAIVDKTAMEAGRP